MKSGQSVSSLRMIGAILLIIGTSIGGGMLALPIATAALGFIPALVYLVITWLLMTVGALCLLEVNAWCKPNSNLITMAGTTIGRHGQVVAWVTYLLLLYSLLCAYVAGGQEIVVTLLGFANVKLAYSWAAVIFLAVFGMIVVLGIRSVDLVNRLVMLIKLIAYLIMIISILPFVKVSHLIVTPLHFSVTFSTLMIMITSYGFAIIIPSLRSYFHNDLVRLRKAVWIGSCVPLIVYLIWEAVIFATAPQTGPYSLAALSTAREPVAALMQMLSHLAQSTRLIVVANFFTSICVITAFLGISLCLVDFLADGLNVQKRGWSGALIYALVFVPPLILTLFAPRVFMMGLSIAGIVCVLLLILLPVWMLWAGLVKRNFEPHYKILANKSLLLLIVVGTLCLLCVETLVKI